MQKRYFGFELQAFLSDVVSGVVLGPLHQALAPNG